MQQQLKILAFFILCLGSSLVARSQTKYRHPEVEAAIKQWYDQHPQVYQLSLKDSTFQAEVGGFDAYQSDLIHFKWQGMLFRFVFRRNVDRISTHADSLQKYLFYASVDDIATDMRLENWRIHPYSQVYYDGEGLEFIDKGKGRFVVKMNWEIGGVYATKQSEDCRRKLNIMDAPPPKECICSHKQSVPLHINIDISIPALDAPDPNHYKKHLKQEQVIAYDKKSAVLSFFDENQQLDVKLTTSPSYWFQLKKSGKTLWEYEWKLDQKHRYLLKSAVRDSEGHTYVLANSEEDHTTYCYIFKWDNRGKLVWKIKESIPYGEFNCIHVDKNGAVAVAGSGVTVFDAEGRLLWKHKFEGQHAEQYGIRKHKNRYIVTGTVSHDEIGFAKMVVYIFSRKGKLLNRHGFGGSGIEELEAFCPTHDRGWILAGETSSKNGDVKGLRGENNIWVIKVNRKFQIEWQICLGSSNVIRFRPFKVVHTVYELEHKDILIIGHNTDDDVEVQDFGGVDLYFALLDQSGNLKWQQSMGTLRNDYVEAAHYENQQLKLFFKQHLRTYSLME